jgi:hypothetical protein
VSVRTVKRVLEEEGIQKWRARKRALLAAEHAAQRPAWAKIPEDWVKGERDGVIFGDECSVVLILYGCKFHRFFFTILILCRRTFVTF